jgi:hypothetical protein
MGEDAVSKLSTDKHCEILDLNLRDKIATIYSSFRLFVQLYAAIIGGSVWLQSSGKVPAGFATVATLLAGLVSVTCSVMILDAQRSWYGFRKHLSEVSTSIPPPKSLIRSSGVVGLMVFVMTLALVVFYFCNPLRVA